MNPTSGLLFNNLHKRFGRRSLLNGINISLYSGACTLLIGANGAGKSTLLRILAGLERPEQGQVDCGLGASSWRRCRRSLQDRVLYMHQQPYLFEGSVTRNLAYALPKGLDRATRERRITMAVEWAKLEGIAEMPAKTVSGGERQRIALARAWLREPPVMLLDEPTSNMDQEGRMQTMELLLRLKQAGIAMLVASHDPAHFDSLADTRVHLQDGLLLPADKAASNITPLRRVRA